MARYIKYDGNTGEILCEVLTDQINPIAEDQWQLLPSIERFDASLQYVNSYKLVVKDQVSVPGVIIATPGTLIKPDLNWTLENTYQKLDTDQLTPGMYRIVARGKYSAQAMLIIKENES